MGVSTNAILFWGLVFDETDETILTKWDETDYDTREKEKFGIGYHCSDEYSIPYIYQKNCHILSYRGETTRINPLHLHQTRVKYNLLEEFCKKYDIPFDESKVGWWMVSYHG